MGFYKKNNGYEKYIYLGIILLALLISFGFYYYQQGNRTYDSGLIKIQPGKESNINMNELNKNLPSLLDDSAHRQMGLSKSGEVILDIIDDKSHKIYDKDFDFIVECVKEDYTNECNYYMESGNFVESYININKSTLNKDFPLLLPLDNYKSILEKEKSLIYNNKIHGSFKDGFEYKETRQESYQDGGFTTNTDSAKGGNIKKPVIYLYPKQKIDVLVKLHYDGELIATYPEYDNSISGRNVTAYPDSKVISKSREYSYIFWEGNDYKDRNYDLTKGFVVKGSDTVSFLQDKLSALGLTPKEYNEFIVYRYPLMKDNKYNLIHFAGKEYTDGAKLDILPKPDSLLRVFMVYKALDKSITITEQKIDKFDRKGFAVVEWGGTELK